MMTLLQVASVEASVYRAVREDILHLVLIPGARLAFDELARRYGVSHTPVRQALRRLESEGLVVSSPRRGSRVAPLSFDELEEIQAIRLGVETMLARYGAAGCTSDTLVKMEGDFAAIDDALHRKDLDGYLEHYRDLRDACYACAQRPRLLQVNQEQRRRVERYLRFLCADIEALQESRRHQAQLLDACRARNGRAAETAARTALLWTLDRLGQLLDVTEPMASVR
jgi:DNA-binding GntR family transcriptional regulator